MSEAYEIDLNGAVMDGANENGGMITSAGGGGARDHRWQKVTYAKKQRRQATKSGAAGGAQQKGLVGDSGGRKGGSDLKVCQPLESAAQERRGQGKAKQQAAENGVGMVSTINHGLQKLPSSGNEHKLQAAKLTAAGGAEQREVSTIGGGGCASNLKLQKLPFFVTKQRLQAAKLVEAGGAQQRGLVVYNFFGKIIGSNSMRFGVFGGSNLEESTTEGGAGDGSCSSCSCWRRGSQSEAGDGGCSSSRCWRRLPVSFGSFR